MPPKLGQICRTPYKNTSCFVKVLDILDEHAFPNKRIARVLFLEDSPAGYSKHTEGDYFLEELKPVRKTDYCDHPCDEYFQDGSCRCTNFWDEAASNE